jgi:hypothetical protein
VVRLVLVAVAATLLVNLVRSIQQNVTIQRQLRSLERQISAEENRSDLLRDTLVYERTESFRELELRRRLGYVQPGEKLVLVPENRDQAAPTNQPTTTTPVSTARQEWDARPPYEQWWLLFFGPQSLLEEVFRP